MNHTLTHEQQMNEAEAAADDRTMFGFWIYIMTDLLMFAVLFAVYAVLRNSTDGGPGAVDLLSPDLAFVETLLLLTSSFTVGVGMIAARKGKKPQAINWFIATFVLGLAFLCIEVYEFYELIHEGQTMQLNAFLSAFFVLLGTHGAHILAGLIWLAIILVFVAKRGLTHSNLRKLALLSLFWHFLDVVWIFIFTVVYLMPFTGV
jgi:cytochrome o ubiquinol oxidase subunit 3